MKCVVHLNGQMTTIFLVKKVYILRHHLWAKSFTSLLTDLCQDINKVSSFIFLIWQGGWGPEASTYSKWWKKKKIWEAFWRSCIFGVGAFMRHFLEGIESPTKLRWVTNTNLYWEFKAKEIFYLVGTSDYYLDGDLPLIK